MGGDDAGTSTKHIQIPIKSISFSGKGTHFCCFSPLGPRIIMLRTDDRLSWKHNVSVAFTLSSLATMFWEGERMSYDVTGF